jgi:hypothetical protein
MPPLVTSNNNRPSPGLTRVVAVSYADHFVAWRNLPAALGSVLPAAVVSKIKSLNALDFSLLAFNSPFMSFATALFANTSAETSAHVLLLLQSSSRQLNFSSSAPAPLLKTSTTKAL